MSNNKLTLQDVEHIVELYSSGHSVNDIAGNHRISRTTVIVVLKEKNVYKGKYVKTPKRVIIRGEKSKYDHLFFEPQAQGMDYEQYLDKYNLKRNRYL